MELDRRYITRKDFPAARRGYDPDEVDQHLIELADAVDDLRQQAERPPQTTSVAGAAAEQVRSIVEAAERSAGEIEQRADLDARRVREEAEDDARATRLRADGDAAEHIRRVEEATRAMLERADAVDGQVTQLLEGLRATADAMIGELRNGADQLGRELAEIRRGLGDVSSARPAPAEAAPPPVREPAPEYAPEPEYHAEPEHHAPEPEEESLKFQGDELHPGDVHAMDAEAHPTEESLPPAAPDREPYVPEPERASEPEPRSEELPDMAPPASEPAASGGGAGSEGARLIALNMALNGTPRDETAAYLAENFDLTDQDALLDEVYSRAGT